MNARIEALQAETPEFLRPYVSRESYIDEAIQQLICKGWNNLTDTERQEYLDLVQERVDLMIPEAVHRFRRYQAAREIAKWASTNRSKFWWQNGWQTMIVFLNTSWIRFTTWWRNAPDA